MLHADNLQLKGFSHEVKILHSAIIFNVKLCTDFCLLSLSYYYEIAVWKMLIDLCVTELHCRAALSFYTYFLLCITAEFNDRRQSRYDDRRRSDRSREHSRERYYDPYEYSDYYRAAYARG